MKTIRLLVCAVFGLTLLLLMISETSASWDQMEVLKYDFIIESNDSFRDQWYPWVEYNSGDNEFMVLWRTSGPLRENCDPGDEYECTGNFQSMEGRRVSTDGNLLGSLIQLFPPDEGYKNGARFTYNPFTNQYVTANPVSPTPASADTEMLIARMDNLGNYQYGPSLLYPTGHGESPLPVVVFNSVRREYLVVYSDRNIFSSDLNLIGFIANEDGTPRTGPFPVGNQLGDYYAPRGAYNPNNDTYLVVWEDFRNVPDWLYPCDIYGALLDADGNMIVEIPVLDDFALGEPDAGDQRVPVVAYNPDKDEFFVVWEADEMPTVDDSAIFGRFLNPDGSFKGAPFKMVDAPRQQHWPDVKYIQDEQKYFMVWNDCRNDGLPPGTGWYLSPSIDVYAQWVDDIGNLLGDEILIAEVGGQDEGWKQVPIMAYSPVDKRFLIAWYDRHKGSGGTYFEGAPSDVNATLYGMPPDSDGDGVPDTQDNCPDTPNPNQENSDTDSHGDACDNCPLVDNEDQADFNGNGIGDACETSGEAIPTLSEWGMIIFMAIILGLGVVTLLRRKMVLR